MSKLADYITRKDKWHPTEKRKILPSGEVELSFTVAGVDEIKRWIYSWIPNVAVVEPKWFREQIKKELSESLENY
ncbi:MAG: WYL domain-containing protein [Nitrospirota bacterium]